ncbi:hypothetical protein [Paraburkholderia tagetis]|uniref:Uncharacterized protein n=1 Tax=Paraburkholderia tagetis TaxID=2913261 RepID=A0A9X1UIV4_9BURK|nr:hypothetical protein [Paraburkholderia tagetis]MCG5075923.1 hypothetical protein [Paraburkholderia tagetis]
MSEALRILLWTGLVLVLVATYLFFVLRLAIAVQPYRLKLAREGERLSRSPGLTAFDREYIRFCLDNAYSGAIVFSAIFALPLSGFRLMLSRNNKSSDIDNESKLIKSHHLDQVSRLFYCSVIAANPICALIVAIELIAIVFFGVLWAGNLEFLRRIAARIIASEYASEKLMHT